MTFPRESLFKSSFRAFCVAFFSVVGALLALIGIGLIFAGIYSATDDETFSSKVKILPDAQGNREELSTSTPVIVQIDLDGQIGKDELTGKKIENLLLNTREDDFKNDRVKALLLVINSPGGGVNDSAIIYQLLKAYKERYQVPIYAYVNGLCASGGYYIACAADKIFASDVSLVGSIGVLSWPPFMNVTEALGKLGVDALTVSAGKGKDQLNPFRKWGPDEERHYQKLINYFYANFVAIVTEERPVDQQEIVEAIGAEVVPAPQAQALGLIDASGVSRNAVVELLAKELGIEEKYQVVGFETKTWWRQLFNERSRIKHELVLPSCQTTPFTYIYQ